MIYQTLRGFKISRLTLGTVQLGLNYGIANVTGKPDEATSQKILALTEQLGINCFDTASMYGDSEEVLGRYLKSGGGPPDQAARLIVTKFKVKPETGDSLADLEQDIRCQLEQSLQRLGLPFIPIYLLHQVKDLYRHREKIIRILDRLVAEGLVRSCGVSIYTGEDLDLMLSYDLFQATQIPINIFDQRLIRSGHLQRLHQAKLIVFARSVFLQGLFFLDPDRLPPVLAAAAPLLRQLRQLAGAEGLSVAQLAFAYVRDLPGITSLVVGAEAPGQVQDNVRMLDGPVISESGLLTARQHFSEVPELVLNPYLWQSH
jgi:aryl-alcohol dehydrogenase-like predicted oxidoreductase